MLQKITQKQVDKEREAKLEERMSIDRYERRRLRKLTTQRQIADRSSGEKKDFFPWLDKN